MKPMLRKLGKNALSLSILGISILILTPLVALVLKLFFSVAVKE